MLNVSDISSIIFENGQDGQLINQINQALKLFIDNDVSMVLDSTLAPKLWEQTWMNNSDIAGYKKGTAVWVNTDADTDIVNQRYSTISGYVINNSQLNNEFQKINMDDSNAVNEFFRNVVNGTALPGVSALYYLGDVTDRVKIMVSKIDNNKDYPTASSWYSMISSVTMEEAAQQMLSNLDAELESSLEKHIADYHLSAQLDDEFFNGFISKIGQTDLDAIKKQYFYDHVYCTKMEGFDFIKKQECSITDGGEARWYRLWNSGYLEQGGFIVNTGESILTADFMMNYNYPESDSFYQEGFSEIESNPIRCEIGPDKRYTATVTPIVGWRRNPYQNPLNEINGGRTYVTVDIMAMKNSGFSFMNIDQSQEYFEKYSFYVGGYTSVNDPTGTNTVGRQTYTVTFVDTEGE